MTATTSSTARQYSAIEQRNIAQLKEYVRVVHNAHDIQAFPRFFSPDFQNPDMKVVIGEDAVNDKTKNHVQSSQEMHEMLSQAFPDLHTTLLDITADGNKVCALMRFEGTHTGELKKPMNGGDSSIPPTNQKISFNKMGIMTFEEDSGLIVGHSAVTDFPATMEQLKAAAAVKVIDEN